MNFLRFSWLVSLIATFGSLYFSEVRGFIPCELCWYQRILMYPLVIFQGIMLLRNEVSKAPAYILPFSITGATIAFYHYLLQNIPSMVKFSVCTKGVPCEAKYVEWFGFITIPFLSFTAFTLINISMGFLLYKEGRKTPTPLG